MRKNAFPADCALEPVCRRGHQRGEKGIALFYRKKDGLLQRCYSLAVMDEFELYSLLIPDLRGRGLTDC